MCIRDRVGDDAAVVNDDKKAVAEILTAEAVEKAGYDSLDAAKEDGVAFVFMGHGTSHTAKVSYSQMQTQMNDLGYENVFIGTVEGEPCLLYTSGNQAILSLETLHFSKAFFGTNGVSLKADVYKRQTQCL